MTGNLLSPFPELSFMTNFFSFAQVITYVWKTFLSIIRFILYG